jgi:hypothetical protein
VFSNQIPPEQTSEHPSCLQLFGAHVVVVLVVVVLVVVVVVVTSGMHAVDVVSHDASWPANAGGKQSQPGQFMLLSDQSVPFQLQMQLPVQLGGPVPVVVVFLKYPHE